MGLYKRRQFRSHEVVHCAGIRLKPYSIAAAGREDVDIRTALDHVQFALPESPLPWMRHRGLGFLVYHRGEEGDWLLARAWVEGDIQAGLLSNDCGRGFKPVEVPACECVWETAVTAHERNAWVRHMMAENEDPDGYLGDRLPDGFH